MNIVYPEPLKKGDKIAISALSSGVKEGMHYLVHKSKKNLESKGFEVEIGQTVWSQNKGRSAPVDTRLSEFMNFWLDPTVSAIIPPWGGNFAIDLITQIDWELLKETKPKWIIGYSDISTFNFVFTSKTGIASAHGPNAIDLSFSSWDSVTEKWTQLLNYEIGNSFTQHSSKFHQREWPISSKDNDVSFSLDYKTEWKMLNENLESEFSGVLIGGCLNTLRMLIGTPYDFIEDFREKYSDSKGLIWYLECTGLDSATIYQTLWQMKAAGWFNSINGIIFGRIDNYRSYQDYTLKDTLKDIFKDFNIPVLYDVDIGHLPPQMTLINGSIANIKYHNNKGSLKIQF